MEGVKRGDIYMADLGFREDAGSEQQGERPVVIIQNDIGNLFSPTVIVAAVTSKSKKKLPVHVEAEGNFFLGRDSVIMLEQIRTLDKRKLKEKLGCLDYLEMKNLNEALKVSVGLA